MYFSAKRSPHFILRLLIIQLLSIHHTTSSHRLLSMTAPSIKLSKIDPKLIQNLRNPAEGWLENSYCTPGGEGGGWGGGYQDAIWLFEGRDFWLNASLETDGKLHYHHIHMCFNSRSSCGDSHFLKLYSSFHDKRSSCL